MKGLFYAIEAEFIGAVVSFAGDDASRNQKQGRSFFQRDNAGIRGGVGKQAKRKPGGVEFYDAFAIVQKSRRVACVGVAESPKFFVIAGKSI